MNQVIKQENFAVQQIEKKQSILALEIVQRSLTSTEARIAKLSTSTAIKDIPDSDLYFENNEEKDKGLVAKTAMIAKGIARDFSIRNVDRSEAFRFFDILKKYYGVFTLDEVRTAFELALVGELDAYLPKDKNGVPDKNHYQVFSVEFITKILGAYKSYRSKVWTKVYSSVDKLEQPITETEKQEALENFVKTVQDLYLDYCDGRGFVVLFPRTISEFLIKKGFIENRELSEKDFSKALISIKQNSNINPFLKISIVEAWKNGETEKLKAEAENIKSNELVLEAFEKMKLSGITEII
jgi:hypothetical protein